MTTDFTEVGLKVGLEFHQRLDTSKLFCNCSSAIQEEHPYTTIVRKLRPASSELGEIDPAAFQEFLRNKTFTYELFHDETCLIECDEQPPNPLNEEALDIALEIALMLNCDVVDEVHVMRKIVIDGSNTTGFQRTAMIAHQGKLKTVHAEVGINGIFLEEEAAGIIGEKGKAHYRLDRLGVPLIEIATDVMQLEPKQVKEVALQLGKFLRVTGKVQRGLGSIRQDLNVSIKHGNRVEIKGVQDIRILDKLIEYEIQRQQNLIELKEELERRKLKKQKPEIQAFSKYFERTKFKIFADTLKKGLKIHAIVLDNFKDILGTELQPGRRFGTELADIAKMYGLGGIIHTDENLSLYGIKQEIDVIRKDLNLSENDTIVMMVGPPPAMEKTFSSIIERINQAFEGVLREVRKANADGTTSFLRVLPGASRLYPETDLEPIYISEKKIQELKNVLPDEPDKVLEKLKSKYKLSEEFADRMVANKNSALFYEICDSIKGIDANIVANTFLNTMVALKREGFNSTKVTEKNLKELFKAVADKKITQKAIPDILKILSREPSKTVADIIKNYGVVSEDEVRKEIKALIVSNKELAKDKYKAENVFMGLLMKKYKGKVEGALISKILKEELK